MKRICLNQSVLDFMAARIPADGSVVEFGAGYSSRWFADRCASLVSVETSPQWWRTAREELDGAECEWDVQLVVQPCEVQIARLADLVLVDCVEDKRLTAAQVGWLCLKPGGWLVFDDAQRPRHQRAIDWLKTHGEPVVLGWNAEHDIPEARQRVAMAWQAP